MLLEFCLVFQIKFLKLFAFKLPTKVLNLGNEVIIPLLLSWSIIRIMKKVSYIYIELRGSPILLKPFWRISAHLFFTRSRFIRLRISCEPTKSKYKSPVKFCSDDRIIRFPMIPAQSVWFFEVAKNVTSQSSDEVHAIEKTKSFWKSSDYFNI